MPVQYVPILKGKEGEYGALGELSSASKDAMRPLIEVPPVPYDYVSETPSKTVDAHLMNVPQRLADCWAGREIYLDVPWLQDGDFVLGVPALHYLVTDAVRLSVQAVPVITLQTTPDGLEIVRELVANGTHFAIRMTSSDFDEDDERNPNAQVDALLSTIAPREIARADLILDLADVGEDLGRAVLLARSVLGQAPRLAEWRSVALVGASFPENLSEVTAATTSRLPRIEWQMWRRLQRRLPEQRRDLLFGDYGIAHPVTTELDPRTMRMSASIRYTAENEWIVVKGRNVRQHGFDQYYALAREIVGLPEFSGEEYCAGDRFIARCARGQAGPGNATTWRKVGTNHHLTLVARELSSIDRLEA
jgi:hypothetical protein